MEQKDINKETYAEAFKPVPLRAAFYSLVFPGLGQFYNRDSGRGGLFFVIACMLILTAHLIVTIFILAGFWLYNVYQAFYHAKSLKA